MRSCTTRWLRMGYGSFNSLSPGHFGRLCCPTPRFSLGGHLSVAKTFKRLQQRFYWEGMFRDLRKYLKGCLPCTFLARPKKSAMVC